MLSWFLRSWMGEPWLAFNRWLTVHVLDWRLRLLARKRQTHHATGAMLYVPASSLPYHISGYTTRTHEVILALRASGANVHVLTRPGYPWDRNDRRCDPAAESTTRDDVFYQHVRAPLNNRPVLQYALQASKVVADFAQRHGVVAIHAASNHVNALPALLAARRLGIPFQYEMRGLWELTRISRIPDYEGSQGYVQGLQLEALVARHADRLFVISEQLGRYVQEHWGVDPARIDLLPNCVDPQRFVPADAAKVVPHTLAYAGSLLGYEGLDTLIDAVALARQQGCPVRLEIIGDGEVRAQLEEQVQRLGLFGTVSFLGKQTPEATRTHLEKCAVVCIPRKPFKVCQIVTPIKLVEALATGKPVIVPDLPVFRDEMGSHPAGWFFRAGDSADLARVIIGVFADPAELLKRGSRAREYAATQRSWAPFVENVLLCGPRKKISSWQK
ncbi:glycosyltransferase family 4 protein [Aquitalea sp. USM4]|uniref:glycosyltransferase family 4 protein n=1 Tax=Aquitalea sp. USM4 TaxID=1590041 RepID=UPI001F60E2A1|nr:glycosyltransferase family 4 protein [Aquitalea sp. USM4]